MRWPFILGLSLASACSSMPKSTFILHDPQKLARSATLLICGSDWQLRQEPNRFALSAAMPCEGHGAIQVVLNDGSQSECQIGYVTPGAPQRFDFRLTRRSCELTFESVGPVS